MSERKKHHWLSNWFFAAEEQELVPFRYLLTAGLLVGAALLVAAASRSSPWLADHQARLDVNWRLDRGDYSYRLRGQYSIASLSDDFVTSVSNDATPDAAGSQLYVPSGLYRVTLEPGYTLERVGNTVEVVPASLVSPNPVVIMAKEGRTTALGLSLVDMPATTVEPEEACMNG
jgi:hypothetical protein